MLDITRLSSNQLLIQYGWSPSYKVNIEEYYRLAHHDGYSLQLSIEELFPAVKDIIESLEGIVIGNLHPSLKLGIVIQLNFPFLTMMNIMCLNCYLFKKILEKEWLS